MGGEENTLNRVERAAIRLFIRNGITETSIRDISIESGVPLGTIYNQYKSKKDIVWGLFVRGWSGFAQDLRRIARNTPTFDTRIRAMTQYVFQRFDDDSEFVHFIWFNRHEQLRRVHGNLPNPHLVFRLVIIDAMRSGDIPRRDPEIMATLVMGALIQTIDTKVLGRIPGKLSDISDDVADACLRMLGARPTATDAGRDTV